MKPNRKGRNSPTLLSFVPLERYMMNSAAWIDLTAMARAAYAEIVYHYNGSNNGRIQMAAQTLGDRLRVNKSTASRAIKELVDHGFVEVARPSAFSLKTKQAAEYRLTAFRCDLTGALPSKAFMRWVPKIQISVASMQPNSCIGAPGT